jgi:hypothetical protein
MAHRFETNECTETSHGTDRETGRPYTIIGWIKSEDGQSWPVLVPDEIALGEPMPIRAERAKGQPVIVPDGV